MFIPRSSILTTSHGLNKHELNPLTHTTFFNEYVLCTIYILVNSTICSVLGNVTMHKHTLKRIPLQQAYNFKTGLCQNMTVHLIFFFNLVWLICAPEYT